MSKRGRRKIATTRPKVDIVMPVYGEPGHLKGALESLWSYDAGEEYTLTLVDDVSPDRDAMEEVYSYASLGQAQIVRHPKNKGFAGTCNTGARKGKSPLILLLNTDVLILHEGWLKAMVDEFERDREVGVVGALLSFFPDSEDPTRPAGTTQHAGVVFDILGRPYHIFVGWPIDHPKVAQRREMNCVTGACLMVRRNFWRRVGGLDEDYTRGNFEDVQLCLQARLSGLKVVFTPAAHLHHFAGGSGNTMTADRNAQLFQLKMGAVVEYDEWRYW